MANELPLHRQDPTGRFSDRAADYAAARPSYPPDAIRALMAGLGDLRALRVADVGAGTGISARLVADAGAHVDAIEPNAGMRAAAKPHPRVTWHAGAAEATHLPDASVDLVVCAQAFHWFDLPRAMPELVRVLKPGGRLAVMWNERSRVTHATTATYSALTRVASDEHEADRAYADPAPRLAAYGLALEDPLAFDHEQPLDRDGLLRRAFSASYVPKTGPRADVLRAGLLALHARDADATGRVHLRYTTHVVAGRRP